MITDEVTRICSLVRITRTDGTVLGLTDRDEDVILDEVLYKSACGYTPTNYETTNALEVGNADISGLFNAAGISLEDVENGLYDMAAIDLFVYDWGNDAVIKHLAKGWWGQVTHSKGIFSSKFQSLSMLMKQPSGRIFTRQCDANFGDSRCGIDLEAGGYIKTVTVKEYFNSRKFSVNEDLGGSDNYCDNNATFVDGDNAGRFVSVKSNNNDTVELYSPAKFALAVGDTVKLIKTCKKDYDTCKDVYNNVINFRGFNSIPMKDDALYVLGKS